MKIAILVIYGWFSELIISLCNEFVYDVVKYFVITLLFIELNLTIKTFTGN